MTNEAPILDENIIAELLESVDGDEAFVADLASTYLAEGPAHMRALEDAVTRGDIAAAVRPAHTMKSSSAALGALRLSQICRDIEHAARDGRSDGLTEALAEAKATWELTVAAINERRLAG